MGGSGWQGRLIIQLGSCLRVALLGFAFQVGPARGLQVAVALDGVEGELCLGEG